MQAGHGLGEEVKLPTSSYCAFRIPMFAAELAMGLAAKAAGA